MIRYAIRAFRSSNSMFGAAEGWVKNAAGNVKTFGTLEEAKNEATRLWTIAPANVTYEARVYTDDA